MCDKTFILTDKIEFVPDEEMEKKLWFNICASAFVYNKTLEYSIYHENLVREFGIGNKFKVNRTYTQKILKTLKKQYSFLKNADSTCLQSSTDRLINAYNGYYDHRTDAPKFKKRKKNPVTSITLRNNLYDTKEGRVGTIRWLSENELRATKLGTITVKHRRHINGRIKEMTLKYENGHWYMCIVYELDENKHGKFSENGLYVGIDVGLIDFLSFSNGKVIAKPDLKKINGRISYYQQKLSRKKEGGSNWKKTLKKLHKWIMKKNNVVNDYCHKVSYNIVKHCKFIAMETLNIRGLLKGNLSRSIHEIGWGKLIRMIKYKAELYGREFIQINQWFPSSKKCHVCGKINYDLGLEERQWECPHCYTVHQRDVNAAKNILDEGLRATGSMVLCLVDFIPINQNKFLYKYEWKCFDETVGMA